MMVLRESAGSGGARPRRIFRARTFSSAWSWAISSRASCGQLAVGRLGFERRGVFRQVGQDFQIALAAGGQFLETGVFAGQLLRFGGRVEQLRVAQGGLHFDLAAGEFFNVGA